MNLRNLRVDTKLWLAVTVFTLFLLLKLLIAGINSVKIRDKSEAITLLSSAKMKMATQWAGLAETISARMTTAIISGSREVEIAFEEVNAADQGKIAEIQKGLGAMPMTEVERQQMAKISVKKSVVLSRLVVASTQSHPSL